MCSRNVALIIGMIAILASGLTAQTVEPSPTPPRFKIAPSVAQNLLVTHVEPQYPRDVIDGKSSGSISVVYGIDKEGRTKNVRVLLHSEVEPMPDPLAAQAVIDAVKQWKYKPYLLNGNPIDVETTSTLTYDFGTQPSPPVVSEAPRKFSISQGVAQKNLLHSEGPRYPTEAKAKHIQGSVILQGTIDRQGNVIQLKPLQGDPLLVQAAIDAVKEWKYKPYTLNGEPVDVETTFKIDFHL